MERFLVVHTHVGHFSDQYTYNAVHVQCMYVSGYNIMYMYMYNVYSVTETRQRKETMPIKTTPLVQEKKKSCLR